MTRHADGYKPAINVCSAAGVIVMLTVDDGTSCAQVYLSKRQARELAAAIEHHSDLCAIGTEASADVECG
jgi:hypothetical protein